MNTKQPTNAEIRERHLLRDTGNIGTALKGMTIEECLNETHKHCGILLERLGKVEGIASKLRTDIISYKTKMLEWSDEMGGMENRNKELEGVLEQATVEVGKLPHKSVAYLDENNLRITREMVDYAELKAILKQVKG